MIFTERVDSDAPASQALQNAIIHARVSIRRSANEIVRRCGRGIQRQRAYFRVAFRGVQRRICAQLDSVAYTTVMTTMDRLFKKGLLGRKKVGRAFVYHAVATREEVFAR